MAEFYTAVTTDSGLMLSADLLTGEQIVFTKLVTGSGIYTDEEMNRSRLQTVTQLRDKRQEFEISRITRETDFCILLKALISNVELTEGYRITEIGIYAKKQGEEGEGILYSISVAKEADFIPRYNGLAAVEIVEEYYITVSNAAEISIETGSSAAVLKEDLEKLKKEIEVALSEKIEDLKRQIGSLKDLMTTEQGSIVGAINEVTEAIRPLVEYSFATDQDIDDIINEIYVNDRDWAKDIDIISDQDIDAIINETYIDEIEEDENTLTDEDIDAIINSTYVEIDEIIDQTENENTSDIIDGEKV